MISFLISFAPISHLLKKDILENFLGIVWFEQSKTRNKKMFLSMRTDKRLVLERILKGLTKLAKVGSFLNKF